MEKEEYVKKIKAHFNIKDEVPCAPSAFEHAHVAALVPPLGAFGDDIASCVLFAPAGLSQSG